MASYYFRGVLPRVLECSDEALRHRFRDGCQVQGVRILAAYFVRDGAGEYVAVIADGRRNLDPSALGRLWCYCCRESADTVGFTVRKVESGFTLEAWRKLAKPFIRRGAMYA